MFLKHQVSAQHLASGQLVAGGSEMLERLKGCVLVELWWVHNEPHTVFAFNVAQVVNVKFVLDGCHPLAFTQQESQKKMNLDKRRPIRKWFVGFKDLCADWTSCKARQLVISYCFILFLHDLTSKVMPWQLLLGMFPIVKAGCGLCRTSVCSKPAHPHSFRSCTLFACICQEDKHVFPYCLHTICYIFQETKDRPIHFGISENVFSFFKGMEFI